MFAADFEKRRKRSMQKNLVIVESPKKANTIEKFLGKDFNVMSCKGHVRDLKVKDFSIDIENNYAPEYVVPTDKKKLISELKAAASKAETVWLASDEDREGEAISWHLCEVLGLKAEKTKRIVFHEITETAILHAIETPRDIDQNLVNAQQARRVLDRIVGFELSPILWRKVKPSLSAGRVQSVTARLVVEREREINLFVPESSFRVLATFILPDGKTLLKAELSKRWKTEEEAMSFLEQCKNSTFSIDDISKKPMRKSPSAPFTTSTLQQEASRKLGYSVGQTMSLAQRLYEAGHITYMRTDSFNLSDLALNTCEDAIKEQYGEQYYKRRHYHTKSKGAQEAHEAIRPTFVSNINIKADSQEQRLYDLIRKRTIASQMADAKLEKTIISISIDGIEEHFVATGEVFVFDGFLHVYKEGVDEEHENEHENGLLPKVNVGEELTRKEITATKRFTQRPARYTEASLLHRMDELGIGRPATYTSTIQTIQNRGYVLKRDKEGEERQYTCLTLEEDNIKTETKKEIYGTEKNKLFPTDIGLVVNDFLTASFPTILNYNFTASIEKDLDLVASGEKSWTETIDTFYKLFHPVVKEVAEAKTEQKIGARDLGIDPKTGKHVYVKIGRFGPVAQIGEALTADGEKAEKPLFSPLMKDQSIETITLEEALKLFDLPRKVGEYEGADMMAGIGRFGPYIRFQGTFISIPKPSTAMSITAEEAIALIEEKRLKDSQRHIKSFTEEPELEILNGRYGPYIAYQKANFKIPKTVEDPKALTLEECMKIIKETETKPAKKRATSKAKK